MPTVRTLLAAGLGIACLGAPMRTAAQIKTEQEKWCPVWASSPLPEARQGQPYSASLGSNIIAGVSAVQTMPPLPAMPAGLTLAGDKVQGTPTNAGYASFTTQLSVLYPCLGAGATTSGGKVSYYIRKSFQFKVRDMQPPQLSAFSVDPSTVSASGASVMVLVGASDNVGVTRVMLTVLHPDGHQGATPVPGPNGLGSGKWQLAIPLALNSAATPAVYTFTVSVEDADGNVARAGPVTATVAGHAPVRTLLPKRP